MGGHNNARVFQPGIHYAISLAWDTQNAVVADRVGPGRRHSIPHYRVLLDDVASEKGLDSLGLPAKRFFNRGGDWEWEHYIWIECFEGVLRQSRGRDRDA